MPSIDKELFKADILKRIRAGETFRFSNARYSRPCFFGAGSFFVLGISGLLFFVPISFILAVIMLGSPFLIVGIFARKGYIEFSPRRISWKILRKTKEITFAELSAFHTYRSRAPEAVWYFCEVFTKLGRRELIPFTWVKKDRPLPRKMVFQVFVLSLLSTYMELARVPRVYAAEAVFLQKYSDVTEISSRELFS